jgi:predicted small secreted protein
MADNFDSCMSDSERMRGNRVCWSAAVLIGLIVVGTAAMSGCNTVSGIGRDIQEVSDNVKGFVEGE